MTNPPHRGKGACFAWLLTHVGHQGDECLIWPFARFHNGYGRFNHEGKPYRAHRHMCQLVHGDPPTTAHDAAHSCGKGGDGCVNPKHLSWKTRSENLMDRREHGTARRKSKLRFKLTEAQVAEVHAVKGKEIVAVTAARLGVSEANIYHIRAGRSWKTGKREPIGFAVKPYRRPAIAKARP